MFEQYLYDQIIKQRTFTMEFYTDQQQKIIETKLLFGVKKQRRTPFLSTSQHFLKNRVFSKEHMTVQFSLGNCVFSAWRSLL